MITIKDVAKYAGVSPSTVSLVINGSDLVKHETRYKVMQAIEKLNYIPNQAARSLVTKEKKVIGLIRVSNFNAAKDGNDYETSVDTLLLDMLPGIQSVLSEKGYSLLIDLFAPRNGDMDKSCIPIFDHSKIDGAIFIGGMIPQTMVHSIIQSDIPAVFAFSRYENVDYLDTDPEEGIYIATKHLLENGHRDIALINGSPLSQTTLRKLQGYQKALCEYHLPFRESWVETADFVGLSGYNAMKKLWSHGIHPTAIIGSCDNACMGIYRFLYEQGLKCPDDFSLIGYEASMLSAHCVPPMTSVFVSKAEIGAEAAKVLINRIHHPKAKPVNMIIQPHLLLRDSVLQLD